uniref:Uncharacterized protein AlNc14C153G7563 n=1 Tax=Albugo laibachii Nc14 TaxID=890382 RepID=F0WM60_9STRA|nr:conserved hypothetical protein [Albugo laibachii Nc14]|eukprot:CCA22388.1 conserved hypothetical protein [Albugo laibachii Nc14]
MRSYLCQVRVLHPISMEPPVNGDPEAIPSENDTRSDGEVFVKEMNKALANCIELVCPSIQYPPQYRLNPVQQDAADITEIEKRLDNFFVHAKQLEIVLMNRAQSPPSISTEKVELENEVRALEAELLEKNELIEKYSDVIKGWESKFRRLETRLTQDNT